MGYQTANDRSTGKNDSRNPQQEWNRQQQQGRPTSDTSGICILPARRRHRYSPISFPQRINLRRLRLHRRTDAERDQDGDGDDPGGVRHTGLSAQSDVMSDPILPLAGRNRYEKKQVAKSPVPDTACQSTHRRTVRLVIRVDDGLGCRLHPLQRLCQMHRRTPYVP